MKFWLAEQTAKVKVYRIKSLSAENAVEGDGLITSVFGKCMHPKS